MEKYTNAEIELVKRYLKKHRQNGDRLISDSDAVYYLDTVTFFKDKKIILEHIIEEFESSISQEFEKAGIE